MSQRFTGLYRGVWVLGLQVQNSHRSPFVAFRCSMNYPSMFFGPWVLTLVRCRRNE
jgi:hypothetical protein